MAYLFNEDYSMPLTNIAKKIENQTNYNGQQNFFNNFDDLQDAFFAVNPEGDIYDILEWMNDNSDAYYNKDYTEEDIIQYYTDQGYTYNDDTGRVENKDEVQDTDETETEDVEVQVEAPKDLSQITDEDLENGINYQGPDQFKGVVYPNVNTTDTIRKWAWVVENDDGTLTAQFSNTFVKDIYGDFFYENDRGRFYHYKCNISNNVRCG